MTSAVKPEPELQEPQLFALAEPEPECFPVPESDLNPFPILNGIQKTKYQKGEANFLENSAASSIEKARFCTNNLLLKISVHIFSGS
jgi:hypothetical protein